MSLLITLDIHLLALLAAASLRVQSTHWAIVLPLSTPLDALDPPI